MTNNVGEPSDAEDPLILHTVNPQPRANDDDTSWFQASTGSANRSSGWPLHWFASAFGAETNHPPPWRTSRVGWLRHRGGGSSDTPSTSLHSTITDATFLTGISHATTLGAPCFSITHNEPSDLLPIDNTNSSATATPHASSVHLQLNPTLEPPKGNENPTCDGSDDTASSADEATTEASEPTPKTITVHTFVDSTNATWKALNTAKRKFHAFLHYRGVFAEGTQVWIETERHVLEAAPKAAIRTSIAQKGDTASSVDLEEMRKEWRSLWRSGRLLTDRTELVAVYPSDNDAKVQPQHASHEAPTSSTPTVVRKRGGFVDLLQLYTDRVLAMLQDEKEDSVQSQEHIPTNGTANNSDLLQWLESSYGKSETAALVSDNFGTLPETDQLVKLKHFLEWFRSQFPYFYDRCDSCGASIKEDAAAATVVAASASIDDQESSNPLESGEHQPDEDDTDDESDHRTFVGYTYPDMVELQGKASRTELYQCHVCNAFTRFPRYNSATHVIDKRRGRCGEYSMLLFRLLRALNHECRWVVDWADHVWAEVLLTPASQSATSNRRWVHLDPCEAAVDENFIYQDWGKKQTFILGFYLPVKSRSHLEGPAAVTSSDSPASSLIPLIEDITQCYTREPWSAVCERRDESEEQVQSSIGKAIGDLQNKLVQFTQTTSSLRT